MADGAAQVISHLADEVDAGEVTTEVDTQFDSNEAIVVLKFAAEDAAHEVIDHLMNNEE